MSIQSILSISQSLGISPKETAKKLVRYFKINCLAKFVFNSQELNDLCLTESINEFITQYQSNKKSTQIFSSSCPGWVCYAEKRCSSSITDKLSRTRSIQAIFGTIVKRLGLLSGKNVKIVHISVQPCYDRKLESVRPEFTRETLDDATDYETDYVITSYELFQMINESDSDSSIPSVLDEKGFLCFDSIYEYSGINQNMESDIIFRNTGGESGGLALNVFLRICKDIFNIIVSIEHVYKNGITIEVLTSENEHFEVQNNFIKGTDFHEIVLLQRNTSEILLRFLKVYGFRNIQNLFVKLKKFPEIHYNYVEVMACPNGGCLNGGGQVLFHKKQPLSSKINSLKDLRNAFFELNIQSDIDSERLKKFSSIIAKNKINLYANFRSLKESQNSNNLKDQSDLKNINSW